jgi:hypothetical protein
MASFKDTLLTYGERSINAGHNKANVDLSLKLKADNGVYVLGTILKDGTGADAGTLVRWVQGTDADNLVRAVLVDHEDVDTAKRAVAVCRVEGTVARTGLVAATAADGSTTAAPTETALAALRERRIYAL